MPGRDAEDDVEHETDGEIERRLFPELSLASADREVGPWETGPKPRQTFLIRADLRLFIGAYL